MFEFLVSSTCIISVGRSFSLYEKGALSFYYYYFIISRDKMDAKQLNFYGIQILEQIKNFYYSFREFFSS